MNCISGFPLGVPISLLDARLRFQICHQIIGKLSIRNAMLLDSCEIFVCLSDVWRIGFHIFSSASATKKYVICGESREGERLCSGRGHRGIGRAQPYAFELC